MSLLWMEYEAGVEHLVEASFGRERRGKEEYFQAITERARKNIYRVISVYKDFIMLTASV